MTDYDLPDWLLDPTIYLASAAPDPLYVPDIIDMPPFPDLLDDRPCPVEPSNLRMGDDMPPQRFVPVGDAEDNTAGATYDLRRQLSRAHNLMAEMHGRATLDGLKRAHDDALITQLCRDLDACERQLEQERALRVQAEAELQQMRWVQQLQQIQQMQPAGRGAQGESQAQQVPQAPQVPQTKQHRQRKKAKHA